MNKVDSLKKVIKYLAFSVLGIAVLAVVLFAIQVHALKSAARLIGAEELSELETAGREGNIQRIKDGTDEILDKYLRLYERLGEIFSKNG